MGTRRLVPFPDESFVEQVGFQEEPLKQENTNWHMFQMKGENEGKDAKLRFYDRETRGQRVFWIWRGF